MNRLGLQVKLEEILGTNKDNVYFQPPNSVKLKYPCIIYHCATGDTSFADNAPYTFEMRYQVTLIDPDPDTSFFEPIVMLPKCVFDRHFTADNLNHYVFKIYY